MFEKKATRKTNSRITQWSLTALVAGLTVACSITETPESTAKLATPMEVDLAGVCKAGTVQNLASGLSSTTVKAASLPRHHLPGPMLTDGVKHTPATERTPAYCQVTGTFVTNAESGKTAHFLATFPANWNGKYMQIGCSGHCGTFAVSDAATPPVTITTQGLPMDIINKGYASFATDEGHVGFASGKWAVKGPGEVDQEAIDDLLYRSHKVMSKMGKEFTEAFYSAASNSNADIAYSYLSGCSGGGRDALIAALHFPEEFDGIISGSPYSNMVAVAYQGAGTSLASIREPGADVPPDLIALIDPIVKAQCDTLDGVKDGVIQNPMACDFRPEQHLPRCENDQPGDNCFTRTQINTLSTVLTAITDEHGEVVQPGYSVSEVQGAFRYGKPPEDPDTKELWPDTGNPGTGGGGMGTLANATLKVFAHGNHPNFNTRDVLSFTEGGAGPITGFRVEVPRKEVDFAEKRLEKGIGEQAEKMKRFLKLDRKMLIWSNLSDQLLTPYMAINYYKELANMYGGYKKLQKNIRLFGMPGTAHCSGGLIVAPGSIDATAALENWVEKGEAPNALMARQYPATPYGADFSKPFVRTMPLCQFPQMARYSGEGDVNDAANWSCPKDDKGMLTIGESGVQAGVRQ